MSVRIRLRRMGKKKQPHYRIVVADGRAPRDGRFVENVGYYSPVSSPARLSVALDRVQHWVGRGAVVSPTVESLVRKARAGGDDRVALVPADADAEPATGEADEAPGAEGGPEPESEDAAAGESASE